MNLRGIAAQSWARSQNCCFAEASLPQTSACSLCLHGNKKEPSDDGSRRIPYSAILHLRSPGAEISSIALHQMNDDSSAAVNPGPSKWLSGSSLTSASHPFPYVPLCPDISRSVLIIDAPLSQYLLYIHRIYQKSCLVNMFFLFFKKDCYPSNFLVYSSCGRKNSFSVAPHSTRRPSFMTITRSQIFRTTAISWDTNT